MQSKQEMLNTLQEEFERWERLLGGLTEKEIVARDMPSGLSIKDVVAHLMAWQQLSRARLQAALDNADPAYSIGPAGMDPDEDESIEQINAWIHETYLNEPWPAVYGLWKQGFQHFLQLGEVIPDDVLLQQGRYPRLAERPLSSVLLGSYLHHHDEHYEPLVEWLRFHKSTG